MLLTKGVPFGFLILYVKATFAVVIFSSLKIIHNYIKTT